MGLWIIEKQRQTLPVTPWTIGLDLFQVGATIPDLSLGFSAFQLNPGRRTAERLLEECDVRLPRANTEVEIVLTVPHRGFGQRGCTRSGRLRFGRDWAEHKNDRDQRQAEQAPSQMLH